MCVTHAIKACSKKLRIKIVSKVEFQVGDRVKRAEFTGPIGTVKQIREESIRRTIKKDETEEPAVTVTVIWDNGTESHFVPEGLSSAK